MINRRHPYCSTQHATVEVFFFFSTRDAETLLEVSIIQGLEELVCFVCPLSLLVLHSWRFY